MRTMCLTANFLPRLPFWCVHIDGLSAGRAISAQVPRAKQGRMVSSCPFGIKALFGLLATSAALLHLVQPSWEARGPAVQPAIARIAVG